MQPTQQVEGLAPRRSRPLALGAVALTLALWTTTAAAAPRAGVDCGCSATGSFVRPAAPSEASPPDGITGLSPDKTFRVSAVLRSGVTSTVTVVDVASGATVLTAVADDWGFGTKDSQFVVLPPAGGALPSILLYHLTAGGAALVRRIDLSSAGGAVSFSPKGNHAVSFQLSPTGLNATVTVFDPATGADRFRGDYTYTQPIGSPTAGTKATARLGFSPDAGEETFAYWYLSGLDSVSSRFANLLAGPAAPASREGSNFVVGFSRCGDVLGFVETVPDPLSAGLTFSATSVYSTATGQPLSTVDTFPIAEAVTLATTATDHVAQKAAGFVPPFAALAPNTAAAACPAPDPAVTARFDLPPTALSLIPVTFTDTSLVPVGASITDRQWSFGDGTAGSGAVVSHVFAAPGAYTVTLTVTDRSGRRTSVSHPISIAGNQPPVAAYTLTPSPPTRRDLVTLADVSTDDDGIAFRSWIINGETSGDPSVTVHACGPTLTVELTVTDFAGQRATRSEVITLIEPSPPDILVPAGGDLAAAILTACPGDRLQLEAGTYQGGVRLRDVSLRGAGAGASIVEGFGASPAAWVLDLFADQGQVVTVSELTVRGGGLAEAGGGVNVTADTDGLVSLERLEVTGNTAHGGVWIDSVSGEVQVHEASVHHNENTLPSSYGGGIGMSCCAVVTVDGSELAFNTANAAGGQGGGAALAESDGITFTRNHVHDNSAAAQGGGISLEVNTPRVARVALNRFHGNTTVAAGGGAVALRGAAVFAGNLVAGNPAGGVVETGRISRLTVVNSTIADNGGPGLVVPRDPAGASAALVWNTIVTGHAVDVDGPLTGGGANLISAAAGFAGAGDYHLAAGSPALDAGDGAAVPVELTVDLDGEERAVAALAGGVARVDIGADERPTAAGGGGGGVPPAAAPGGGCGQGGLDGLGAAALSALGLLRARRRRGAV